MVQSLEYFQDFDLVLAGFLSFMKLNFIQNLNDSSNDQNIPSDQILQNSAIFLKLTDYRQINRQTDKQTP